MGLRVVLQDEGGKELARLSKTFFIPGNIDISDHTLLKYIDPYGDTTFNRLQLNDLLQDMGHLKERFYDRPLINELIGLIKKCLSDPHTYIKFYGD